MTEASSGSTESIASDLRYVQDPSRDVLLILAMVAAVAWALLVPWADNGVNVRPEAWWGVLVLGAGSITSWYLRKGTRFLSSFVFLSALLVSNTLIILGTGMEATFYGFAVISFVSGMVLSIQFSLFMCIASIFSIFYLKHFTFSVNALSSATLAPVFVTVVATAVSLISTYNLRTALGWLSRSTEQAWRHAEEARERRAELARALKALDESTYRIERLNYRLAIALDAAREAERMKARFAANISHELRTPLNLIVGFSTLLFEHPELYGISLSPKCLHDLGVVHRNALQLQGLINDVLDLSQIHAGGMSIELEPVDPVQLVHEVVDTVQGLAEAKGLSLQVETGIEPTKIIVDRMRIGQVLVNLLNNAVRFTDGGNITLRLEPTNEGLVFSVQDTGVGIPQGDLPHLFKEFHQLDSGLSRRCGGTGLGLAISKAFVELHGGRIWVESKVGEGSTFCFSLPMDSESSQASSLTTRETYPGGAERESVVIVLTHNERGFRLLCRYLVGQRVLIAQDASQAKALIDQAKPQWLIIDRSATASCTEGFESLPATLEAENLCVLICDLPQDLRRPLGPNVKGFLIKPVTNRDLVQVLRQFGSNVEKVLVVDDDRDFVSLVSRLLELPPRVYRILRAYSAEEALGLALERPPDLILLDLGLPGMSGVDFLDRMQKDPALAKVPVVIVTGQHEQLEKDSAELQRSTILITRKDGGLQTEQLLECICLLVGKR